VWQAYPMSPDELIEYYPRLYHMTEDGTWGSIRERGLLSTASLVELFEVPEPERTQLLTQHRPNSVPLTHPVHGRVVIRDQKPLPPSKLERLLLDMAVPQWMELLNGFVFFWLQAERVSRLLNARAYRNRSHLVLTLDTKRLVNDHSSQIRLSPINSGAAAYLQGSRGSSTFKSIDDFPHPRPRSLTKPPKYVAELAVPNAVPNILEYTLRVERLQGGVVLDTVYECP
jgi:hypothetical protein